MLMSCTEGQGRPAALGLSGEPPSSRTGPLGAARGGADHCPPPTRDPGSCPRPRAALCLTPRPRLSAGVHGGPRRGDPCLAWALPSPGPCPHAADLGCLPKHLLFQLLKAWRRLGLVSLFRSARISRTAAACLRSWQSPLCLDRLPYSAGGFALRSPSPHTFFFLTSGRLFMGGDQNPLPVDASWPSRERLSPAGGDVS